MIKEIEIINHLNESLVVPLGDPAESGFFITDVTGIGSPSANVMINDYTTIDGGVVSNARVGRRNVVIYMRLLDAPTIELTRHRSYQFFPAKREVKIRFKTSERHIEIRGVVERNETVIFSRTPTAQISILCADPYFYSTGNDGITETVFYGETPKFTFPFSNKSLTKPLLIMSTLTMETEQPIYYDGDASVGIVMYIKAMGLVKNITIFNAKTSEIMVINTDRLKALTGKEFDNGDEIIISTVKGQKKAELLRDGVYTNILNTIDRRATWFQIEKGENLFAFTADYGANDLRFRIENRTLYEGV